MKTLVVYYSWSNGNTQGIAEQLAQALDADIARIDTVKPYTGSYDDVVAQGQKEVRRGYMPPIQDLGVDLDDYDAVAIGTPTWWYTMAPAVHTFMNDHDWRGKTVVPFMTCGGWPGQVIDDMEKACKGATVVEPMEVTFDSTGGDTMMTSQDEVDAWIDDVKAALA
jgi:flavodoxin